MASMRFFWRPTTEANTLRASSEDGSRYGVKLTVSQEQMRLGTAGPVKLLQEHLTEPFFSYEWRHFNAP